MKINFHGILFIAGVLVVWQIISSLNIFSGPLFPSPIEVFSALFTIALSGELLAQILSSFWRVLAGLALGAIAGIFIGVLMGRSIFLNKTASPLLNILRAFPPVAMIPLFILWFGITDSSKIIAIALAVFFPVWVSSVSGAKQIPVDYIRAAHLLIKSKTKRFFFVILPAALPFIISGVRIGIAMAFIMVFVSELAGASSGLGFFISNAQVTYRIDNLLAGLISLGLLAALTDQIFVSSTKYLFPWVIKNES